MGHHLVWTTHELLLGINTPKKMPVNIPVVHDQYHHSVLVNWDPFPWWIYLFWWPFPKSIPYISPWFPPWVCLRSLFCNSSASRGFPMGKNKNILIKSRKITPQMWRRRLTPSACGWFLHGTVNPSGLVPLRSLTQRRSFSYREKNIRIY